MKTAQRIAKNTMYMFSANIGKKILSFALILIVARYLGAANFGKLSFAIAFVALFTILTDFGARTLINREIARNKENVNKYVSNVFVLKLYLSLVMLIIITIFSNLLGYTPDTRILIYIAAFIYIFQSLSVPFSTAYRAFEKLKYEAFTIILHALIKLTLAIFVVVSGLGVRDLLLAYVIVEFIDLIIKMIMYNTFIHKFSIIWDRKFALNILRRSIPFGVAGIMMTFYDKIDITMLSRMVVDPDIIIGWYSAAYGLLYVFEFIPMSIGAAVYPYTSVAYLKAKNKFKFIYRMLIKYYFYLTIPLAVGTTILANKIIELLFGMDYLPSAIALQVLIWSVVFKFQMYALGTILDSMNKEKLTMVATIISLGTNIILNLILIPKYTFIGASIATVASELVYFIICFTSVSRNLEAINLVKILYKPIIGAIIMGAVLMYFDVNIFILIILGISVYSLSMLIMKAFTISEIKDTINQIGIRNEK